MSPKLAALATRLRAALASPRIVAWATGFAALLSLPVLGQGFLADDHALRGLLLGVPPWSQWRKPPHELFTFYDGDPARTLSLVDHGFSPWWTDLSLRVRFFRPLSAITHWIDFRLWPGSPLAMHLHTVVWYLALVALAGVLYRRVLGPGWVAGFAAVTFAIDNNHGLLIEWISNRNALVAASFAVLALVLHDRARREGRAVLGLCSAGCLALGLMAGEVALGAAGYLVAYGLFYDEAPSRDRLKSLAGHAAVLLAWLVVYRAGGFGVRGSAMYVDPGQAPAAFLRDAFQNLPLLLQTELGGLPPEGLVFASHVPVWLVLLAAVMAITALAAMAPLAGDRRARFFVGGALMATVPSVATFPAARLMLLPSLGLLAGVALVAEGVVDRTRAWRPGPSRWAALYVAAWVGGGHLFLSPITIHASSFQMLVLERILGRYSEGFSDEPRLAKQRVVLVNAPDAFFAYYMVSQRITAGRVAPASLLVLASGTHGVELERRDASTLAVRSDGGFYRHGTELLTRDPAVPMPAGSRVPLSGVGVEVTQAGADGVPTEAVFRFATPLEDEGLRWLEWRGDALVPFVFPAVGGRRRIEAQSPH